MVCIINMVASDLKAINFGKKYNILGMRRAYTDEKGLQVVVVVVVVTSQCRNF